MLCNERGLDGIDFDWEGVDFLKDRDLLTAYTQLLLQTRKQFKKHGLLVSLAMHPGQEKYMIDQKLANAVDRIHFMAYDTCRTTPCRTTPCRTTPWVRHLQRFFSIRMLKKGTCVFHDN